MEHYRDPLADFSDEDLARLHQKEPVRDITPVLQTSSYPYELFLRDRYEWEGFRPDYAVLPLSKGYFAILDKRDLGRVLKLKWRANVQLNPQTGEIRKVYAVANGPSVRGKRELIYLHRFVLKAGRYVVVDHLFGMTLDCRRSALKPTDKSGNNSNARRVRSTDLKRGVELRRKGTCYGAQIKVKGRTIHSKKTWPLTPGGQEAAHQWYLAKHRKEHSHRGLPELGAKPKLPVFPPPKKEPLVVSILSPVMPMTVGAVVDDLAAPF